MDFAAWGHALVGIAYTLFGLKLLQQDRGSAHSLPANGVVAATVLASALWGWMGLAYSAGWGGSWLLMSQLMDSLRYAGWYTFLLMLLHLGTPIQASGNLKRMVMLAATLPLLSIGFVFLGDGSTIGMVVASRWSLMVALASAVFALVLLEQVFRNATEDSRWNIKPLCLGLAVAFFIYLYVFSQ